ncbi:MAG: hypothetical protein U0V04_09705 [Spirosomataceae bacterium]|jgi:hypothetical protein
MKKAVSFLIIALLIITSCKPKYVNNEDINLFEAFCISDRANYRTPIKLDEFKNIEGEIFEKKSLYAPIFYVKVNNNLYSNCKLAEQFKKGGLKVIFSGVSYRVDYICKSGEPCPSYEATPLIISEIKIK